MRILAVAQPSNLELYESDWFRNEAETNQFFDPSSGIVLNGKRFIVGGGVPVIFATDEHEENSA